MAIPPVEVRIDAGELEAIGRVLGNLSNMTDDVLRHAINRTGDMAFTKVKRVVAKQMGIKVGIAAGAMAVKRANFASLTYRIRSSGGYLSLKEFAARQTRKGVSAAPWGQRRVFPHTFIVKSLGGHVFSRTSAERLPLEKKWGPALPNELVKGESAKAFTDMVGDVLPRRVAHELARVLGT